jgi:methyl-accepting chemotaxis protein
MKLTKTVFIGLVISVFVVMIIQGLIISAVLRSAFDNLISTPLRLIDSLKKDLINTNILETLDKTRMLTENISNILPVLHQNAFLGKSILEDIRGDLSQLSTGVIDLSVTVEQGLEKTFVSLQSIKNLTTLNTQLTSSILSSLYNTSNVTSLLNQTTSTVRNIINAVIPIP